MDSQEETEWMLDQDLLALLDAGNLNYPLRYFVRSWWALSSTAAQPSYYLWPRGSIRHFHCSGLSLICIPIFPGAYAAALNIVADAAHADGIV